MEKILPALEGLLRRFRRDAAWLAAAHPRLARQLRGQLAAPDAHVDRLVQGVALLHARTELALQRARSQQEEGMLELQFPEQLRPFPACRVVAAPGEAQLAITGARYCPGGDAVIDLDIEVLAPGAPSATNIYIDGDAAFSAALRNALLGAGALAGCPKICRFQGGDDRELSSWPFTPTGLDPDEALLPRPPGAHAGLALLREYFIYPARFNVLKLGLPALACPGPYTLRLPVPSDQTVAARLLETLRADHLRAGWRPQADLWPIAASPVLLDGRQSEYLLSVPPEWEIFSIDRVRVDGAFCNGWSARRVDDAPPGHEWRIAFHGAAGRRPGAVASIEVTCCERASVLARPARGAGCRWRLNSLLALEQASPDTYALRELLATQAIHNSAGAQAIIGAVLALDARPSLLPFSSAAPLLGTELRLSVDETAFAGCGLLLFAQVMDRFFAECAQINTFTRLVLASAKTGKEVIRCKARNSSLLLE